MLSKALFLPNIIESKKSRIQWEIAKTQETQIEAERGQSSVLSAPFPLLFLQDLPPSENLIFGFQNVNIPTSKQSGAEDKCL